MSAALDILRAGPMTTIQDRGRPGAQAQGVPVSGALDPVALQLANALVGNDPFAPALEIRLQGPRLRARDGRVRVAIMGTGVTAQLSGAVSRTLPAGQSATLEPGEELDLGPVSDSGVCTLAVAGSFDLPLSFGALATYVPAGLGGIRGRALADGDTLPLGPAACEGPDMRLARAFDLPPAQRVRVVPGPQDDYFTQEAMETFLGEPYTVSRSANRMGLRLEGPALEHAKGYNIASDGIVNGAIQVPGNGLPIVLLADRQTTGGYPKIATVASVDLPSLGRALPGTTLRFEAVSAQEAVALRRAQARAIAVALENLLPVTPNAAQLEEALRRENLISGAVGPQRD